MSINLTNIKSSTQEQLKLYLDGAPKDSPIKEKRQLELLNGIFNSSVKYNLNPIYILAHCIHESDWCRSKICIGKNNLFGFGAYDSDPYNSAKTFKNYGECIDYVMNYIKLNYLTKGGLYYVDGTLEGIGKYYASDKSWAVKITSIYNEIVKFVDTLPKPVVAIQKPIITISNIQMNEMKPLECKYLFINTLTNKLYTFSGEKGKKILLLDLSEEGKLKARWLNNNPLTTNQTIPINSVKHIDGNLVSKTAISFVGKDFNPGATEQCANFVRHILEKSGYDIGITSSPTDGLSTGYSLASSFSGDDIGMKINNINDLIPGDIVMFKNTYGSWDAGVITHVGIYIGNNMFVHRPTSSKPVQKDNIIVYGHFAEGRRLYNK